jgi:hypothetical protein
MHSSSSCPHRGYTPLPVRPTPTPLPPSLPPPNLPPIPRPQSPQFPKKVHFSVQKKSFPKFCQITLCVVAPSISNYQHIFCKIFTTRNISTVVGPVNARSTVLTYWHKQTCLQQYSLGCSFLLSRQDIKKFHNPLDATARTRNRSQLSDSFTLGRVMPSSTCRPQRCEL